MKSPTTQNKRRVEAVSVASAIDEPAPRTSTAHGGPSSVESSLAADEDELLRRKDVRRGMMAPHAVHSLHSAQIHTGHAERLPGDTSSR